MLLVMLKHLSATGLSLALTLTLFAQHGPSADYKELKDPRTVDHAAWSGVKPGMNIAFGSADVRYDKVFAPESRSLRDSWNTKAWKGEKVHTQFVLYSTTPETGITVTVSDLAGDKGGRIPAEAVTTGFIRYVMTDELNAEGGGCGQRKPGQFDSSLVADGIDFIKSINMAGHTTQPVWLSVTVPPQTPAGTYSGSIQVKNGKGVALKALPYQITVIDRTLPKPQDWAFHLDLWQSPYAIARVHNTPLWSKAHFDAMRPYMKMLAAAGQKVITTSIIYDPWNGQTEDIYGDMVKWTKKKDGSWSYDYTVFDKWVSFMQETGISKEIACFSMIPWNLKFYYFDESTGKNEVLVAKPGTPEYAKHWSPMLADFAKHLKSKGWFNITCIAMDERPMEAMQSALKVIRAVDKDFKVSLAGNYHKELVDDIYDYCVASGQDFTAEERSRRLAKGWPTTYYTCCVENFPNTFTFSPPAESAWLGWHAAAKDYTGYLRWAYNSWVKEPLKDSRFRTWAAGDTYLVYPGPRSSMRFERMIEGIQAYEKIRILKAEGKGPQLEKILSTFQLNALKAQKAGDMVDAGNAVLNSL